MLNEVLASADELSVCQYGATSGRSCQLSGQAKVLLVEDNRISQDLVEVFLNGGPYQLSVVHNGHEAVEHFSRERYAVVLMDCHMPVMDGFQAARVIRSLESQYGWKRTPIIAVTGHALVHDRGQCLDAGMDDYLSKPFLRTDLLQKLNRWVKPE